MTARIIIDGLASRAMQEEHLLQLALEFNGASDPIVYGRDSTGMKIGRITAVIEKPILSLGRPSLVVKNLQPSDALKVLNDLGYTTTFDRSNKIVATAEKPSVLAA